MIPVWQCGTCGMGFLSEALVRRHQEIPDLRDDGAQHDGQPWAINQIRPGERYEWWAAPSLPREEVEVLEVHHNGEEWWVKSRGASGDWWNEAERFVEACFPPLSSMPTRAEEGRRVPEGMRP